MEALQSVETDAQKMTTCIGVVRDESHKMPAKLNALEELQYLVEDIDNANGS